MSAVFTIMSQAFCGSSVRGTFTFTFLFTQKERSN